MDFQKSLESALSASLAALAGMGGNETTVDQIGRNYLTLALNLDRHLEGFIDAYYGPPELKAEVQSGDPRSLDRLAGDVRGLQQAIEAGDYDAQRKDYLTRQTRAMSAIINNLSGQQLGFVEEVELYFDISPEMVDESQFEAAHAELEQLLPGDGSVHQRFSVWEKRLEVPRDRVLPVFERVCQEARSRTLGLFELPPGESVQWELVQDKPWRAYNRYLGKHRSVIEVNTDLPAQVNRVLTAVAHEAYPGHHTEGAIKEYRLYEGEGRAEHAVHILAPEGVLAEGIAESALQMIFTDADQVALLHDELCPLAGLEIENVVKVVAVERVAAALRGVTGNAALLLHRDGKAPQEVERYIKRWGVGVPGQVAQVMRFLQTPLWRSYVFNYTVGKKLLAPLLEGPDRVVNFARLLSEPFTPTQVRQWVAERGVGTGG
jgi:hypothetical protein